MASHNLPLDEWNEEQKAEGLVQIHVQYLRAGKSRVRNGASMTIHATAREGLFDDACKSVVDLCVERGII